MPVWTERQQVVAKLKEGMRSGHMIRNHPVARMLKPYLQLTGGFMIYRPDRDSWELCVPTPGRYDSDGMLSIAVCEIPTSSTLDECRSALADMVGVAARG